MRDGGQVVDETQNAGGQRGKQHEHELGGELAHQQAGQRDRDKDDDAAHGGRTLFNQMTLGAVSSDLLADTLDL